LESYNLECRTFVSLWSFHICKPISQCHLVTLFCKSMGNYRRKHFKVMWMESNTFKIELVWLDAPQQQSNWVCSFYVMKFIQKFCDYMAKDLESSIEVCAFKPLSAFFSLLMCKFFPNALNTNLCHYTCFAADDP